jgi:serine/threonine-protein kinase haspin
MMENSSKKKHHRRSGSLFGSASNFFSAPSSSKMNTYGRKRNNNGHRSVLTQSHIEHQLWSQKDELPTTNGHGTSSTTTTTAAPSLVGLGVLDFEESSKWETETTQVLSDITRPRPVSVGSSTSVTTASSKSGGGPLSKMARAFSTRSTSSKSTIEPNSKHTSMSSTVSTINNKVTRISVVDTNNFGTPANNTPRNNNKSLTREDSDTNLSIKMRRNTANPNLTLSLDDKDDFSSTAQEEEEDKENVFALDIPKIPALTDSTTPVLTPTSTTSLKSRDSKFDLAKSSPSAASFLSFKKDPSDLKHKKVNKSNISAPGQLIDSNDFFADSSTPVAPPTSATACASATSNRRRKRRSNHKNTSSLFSSISSSSLFSQNAGSAANTSGSTINSKNNKSTSPASSSISSYIPKKSSFADIKKSFLSLSSSSSTFFKGNSSSKTAQPENEKPVISLPTPVDTSREKLRNKLRASNSLMSLARSDTSNSLVAVPAEQYQQSQLDTLLGLCNSSSICDFTTYISDTVKEVDMTKLAEASFSEVFIQRDKTKNTSMIYKIMAFGNEELEQVPVQDIIQELSIARLLMSLDGFVDVIDAAVVKGSYPEYLINQWDQYAENNKSENFRPDFYGEEQLYCIMVLSDAGTDLEHFALSSWLEAESVFWQTVNCLSNAEEKYKFEHRDLHWGNLVISTKNDKKKDTGQVTRLLEKLDIKDVSETNNNDNDDYDDYEEFDYDHTDLKVTLIDYTLSRANNTEGSVIYTRLDHPDFFRGKGDYQFDIYRFMRSQISTMHLKHSPSVGSTPSSPQIGSNATAPNTFTDIDWSMFCGKSNVLWLHYVVDKLLNGKGLQKVTATRSGRLSSGGSNGSLTNGKSKGGNLTEEARACKALETIHQTIDPRKKKFKKQNGQMSFQDFESAGHLLNWALENKVISQELVELLDLH